MTAESLDARITQALQDVAGEHDLLLWRHRLYGNGDSIVAFHRESAPHTIAALLPIDQTLRARMTAHRQTKAGLRRILRADAFSDHGDRDEARELCRLGLVGCHALTETLPHDEISAGLRVRVLFDTPGVEIMTEAPEATTVALNADLVRLLWQFRPADRFARAYRVFRRQLVARKAQRASG